MASFDETWATLVEQAQEIDVVETFSKGKKNDVRYDERKDAICFYSRESDPDHWEEITRDSWQTAWEELQTEGELHPDEFRKLTGDRRGSTAVPFLHKALDLPADKDERKIFPPR